LGVFETIKAGAWEQGIRRLAGTGTPLQKYLNRFIPKDLRLRRISHFEYSKEVTKRRLANPTDRRDFVWYTLRQKEKRDEISDDEILVNMALFM